MFWGQNTDSHSKPVSFKLKSLLSDVFNMHAPYGLFWIRHTLDTWHWAWFRCPPQVCMLIRTDWACGMVSVSDSYAISVTDRFESRWPCFSQLKTVLPGFSFWSKWPQQIHSKSTTKIAPLLMLCETVLQSEKQKIERCLNVHLKKLIIRTAGERKESRTH